MAETTRDEIRALVGDRRRGRNPWNRADAIEQHGITRKVSRVAAIARAPKARAYRSAVSRLYRGGKSGGLEWLI